MKVLVAHPAQQHSYRLAVALKKAGVLGKYATTVYYRKPSITYFISKVLKGKFRTKAESRCEKELKDSEIIQFCELGGMLKLFSLNLSLIHSKYLKIKYSVADTFAKKIVSYVIKNEYDAVITYDDCSPILFEMLKERAPNIIRIMDMSAANLLYMRDIYERDIVLMPAFAEQLKQERSICWNEKVIERAVREIKATEYFLVPSSFVAKSLTHSGVAKEQMIYCPYGIDLNQFIQKEYSAQPSLPVKFIYVGGVKELKGIAYLLDAFLELPDGLAALTIVGQFEGDNSVLNRYVNKVDFVGNVLHSEIPQFLKASDVFILPSLGDSFSFAVLEAAACGLPVIVSENTGVKDFIIDGVDGFVVQTQSKEKIKEKMFYFIKHPQSIETMGRAARKMAEMHTWNIYERQIKAIFEKFSNGTQRDI